MFNLDFLLAPSERNSIQGKGFHKLSAVRLRNEGHDVGEELTLQKAAQVLGTMVRKRDLEFRRVAEGLEALKRLK